jgi:hypothetical protein
MIPDAFDSENGARDATRYRHAAQEYGRDRLRR